MPPYPIAIPKWRANCHSVRPVADTSTPDPAPNPPPSQNPPLLAKQSTVSETDQRIPETGGTARTVGPDGGMNVQRHPSNPAFHIKIRKHFASCHSVPKNIIEVYFGEWGFPLSGESCPHEEQVGRPLALFKTCPSKVCAIQGIVCAPGGTGSSYGLARKWRNSNAGTKYRRPRQCRVNSDVPAIGLLCRIVRRWGRLRGGLVIGFRLKRRNLVLVRDDPYIGTRSIPVIAGDCNGLCKCRGAKDQEKKQREPTFLFRFHQALARNLDSRLAARVILTHSPSNDAGCADERQRKPFI